MGRDASPVLAAYPKKDPALSVRGPPAAQPVAAAPVAPPAGPPTVPTADASASPPPAPQGLITLDRPFDLDDFSRQLGESSIRVVVPRENLPDLLARVSEFMNFGIYVYEFLVRPAPGEMLKTFEVELQRVDFSPAERRWVPFRDRGRADTPFGPGTGGAPPG